ncbi:Kef-type K+ transport system, membrane component KefB [Arachidicoccus rhizosphaerae]|uniref:Kef-type K+ transport system, membrane component KefB n=1 Tax=Arachidicoccus rhizosphaerae TaxID=551991 RepID=A0A1H4CTC9_9BACT|nr:cation:proton antiporter [Arachidicoccus rhizosphaerae]SEA63591.1 Kef-type K+ transport system, membrane component KefB [Arachidicoccus rhizosphaerae]
MQQIFQNLIKEFQLPLSSPVLIFSLILFIILFAPIVLKRFNLPGLIGLIISGIIIGPKGLDIIANDSAIHLFSTIGILYIMFIAGLELDLQQFKKHRNKSLVFGFFTFFLPLIIGYPVCRYILGYDFDASFLTASMFATHTLVSYPIVSKLGVSKNISVALTVGGTILTDTAVLIILAIILGKSRGGLSEEFFISLGIAIILFSAFMFLVIPRIAKWFFQKMESEKHAHYIFVLAVVFFAAFLSQVIGLEPIIGAFVAGLALNKLIPESSALMNRIEFIGNSLFIPFFLVAVGMQVNIQVITAGPMALLVAGTLSIVAISGKWLAAWSTQKIFKLSKDQRGIIFGLSGSHAAATLAVILVGYEAKILDENILNGTIILILITCIVSSLVTERSAKAILIENETKGIEAEQKETGNKENIIVTASKAIKFEKLLELAVLIKNKKSQAPITILSVVPNNQEAEENILKSRNKLHEFITLASATEVKANIVTTLDHNAASGIARVAKESMADLVITSWPNRARMLDLFIGEKMEGIIRSVDKNLFICRLQSPLVANKRIVIASPPLAELERGFDLWVHKVIRLAEELTVPVFHYGHTHTHSAFKQKLHKMGVNISYFYHGFEDWDNFVSFTRFVKPEDLFVVVSARNGSVSYMGVQDHLHYKLDKYFEQNNKIIIFPKQEGMITGDDNYEEINLSPLNRSLDAFELLGKGIKDFFNKKQP